MTNESEITRESMHFDTVVVGGGPAGLSCAIRLKQRAQAAGREVSVCVVEKGAAIGAHTLSGAVIDPRALDELLPGWRELDAPLTQPAARDVFVWLTEQRAFQLPTPPGMRNDGCYVGSLGALTRWLGARAEALGVEVFPGFAAAEVLYGEDGQVEGIATGDMGRAKDGKPGPNFAPGVELRAPYTVFAEGCRGSLSEQVMARFDLRDGVPPQTYGLGLKEVWEVAPENHKPGLVLHSVGWPLKADTYGGSFLYHYGDNLVAVGFVVGLDYPNPYLYPFGEFQNFKTHPKVRPTLTGAKRIAYGARTLNEGGLQSLPRLVFPGGALVGAAAGFMNVARIKGSHTAMKSAMLCADAIADTWDQDAPPAELAAYPEALKQSWVWDELYNVRNIRPAFAKWGLVGGMAYAAFDTYIMRGRAPWTFTHRGEDRATFQRATKERKIEYPRPDGVVTFDRLSSAYLANTAHDEKQPCHLVLKDKSVAVNTNLTLYDGPEGRYCPAGVYEFVDFGTGQSFLQINAANCLHCKACDILDPTRNITWTVPEGGSGPNYVNM